MAKRDFEFMNTHIYRSKEEPNRINLTWYDKWRGPDKGLITCWEVGRNLRKENPELAEKALNGELPILGWKGGVDKKTKKKEKFGTHNYLAEWQGLRNEDLDIHLTLVYELICKRTGVKVYFISDVNRYLNA